MRAYREPKKGGSKKKSISNENTNKSVILQKFAWHLLSLFSGSFDGIACPRCLSNRPIISSVDDYGYRVFCELKADIFVYINHILCDFFFRRLTTHTHTKPEWERMEDERSKSENAIPKIAPYFVPQSRKEQSHTHSQQPVPWPPMHRMATRRLDKNSKSI